MDQLGRNRDIFPEGSKTLIYRNRFSNLARKAARRSPPHRQPRNGNKRQKPAKQPVTHQSLCRLAPSRFDDRLDSGMGIAVSA